VIVPTFEVAHLFPLDVLAWRVRRFDAYEPRTVLVPDTELVPTLLRACSPVIESVIFINAAGDDDGDFLPVLSREELLAHTPAAHLTQSVACWRFIEGMPEKTRFAVLFY
jgi:hypothetical protein